MVTVSRGGVGWPRATALIKKPAEIRADIRRSLRTGFMLKILSLALVFEVRSSGFLRISTFGLQVSRLVLRVRRGPPRACPQASLGSCVYDAALDRSGLLPAWRALVQLDVAAARLIATQVAAGEVAVGHLDLEYVVPARFALVASADPGGARGAVNIHVVVNDPASGIIGINSVAGDCGGVDVHAVAVVYVVQVTPELATTDAAADAEGALFAGRRADDPAAAGELVTFGRRRWRSGPAGDVRFGDADVALHAAGDHDVESGHLNVGVAPID